MADAAGDIFGLMSHGGLTEAATTFGYGTVFELTNTAFEVASVDTVHPTIIGTVAEQVVIRAKRLPDPRRSLSRIRVPARSQR